MTDAFIARAHVNRPPISQTLVSQLLDALFATRCLLCNQLGSSCCDACWAALPFRLRAVQRLGRDGCQLHGTSLIDFNAVVAKLINAFKDQSRTALRDRFADAMVESVRALAASGVVYLVAVPSRVSSIQQRGFSPGALISRALVRRLEPRFRNGNHLVWRASESADQASLGQQQRKENLVGTMKASTLAAGKRVLLIDDIVTTGSSMAETALALNSVGAEILGFVTFSETILRNIAKSHTNETKKV